MDIVYDAVIQNVKLLENDQPVNIGVKNGKFSSITKEPIQGRNTWNGNGGLVLPPFVEMHTHLDTAFTARSSQNLSGTLLEGIRLWQERKKQLTIEDVIERGTEMLQLLIQHGVLFIRTAVDISDPNLTALHAAFQLREKFHDLIEMQIIAFPQDGLMGCPENLVRMEKAIQLGADAVSAVPHLERTRESGIASLEFCFHLAKKYGVFVHIFSDEVDDGHSRYLEVIADLTIKEKMIERVTASHAIALSYYSSAYASKVISLVKEAKLTIVSCPLINVAMQGRFDIFPKGRGITRIKELSDSGVNVCIAHDDIRSPFYPYGDGNLLQAVYMGAHLAHMTGSEQAVQLIKMITNNGAKAFGMKDYGIKIGNCANFIVFPAQDATDLIAKHPPCTHVFRNGRLIVGTKPAEIKWNLTKFCNLNINLQ